MKKYIPFFVASIFYAALIIFYACRLGWISEDPSRWGEFGDFIGGVVNPIIGLITIWLLIYTLRQEKMSHDEQVRLNEEKNDFEICVALISFYEKSAIEKFRLADIKNEDYERNLHNAKGQSVQMQEVLKPKILELYQEQSDMKKEAAEFYNRATELKSILENQYQGLKEKYILNRQLP